MRPAGGSRRGLSLNLKLKFENGEPCLLAVQCCGRSMTARRGSALFQGWVPTRMWSGVIPRCTKFQGAFTTRLASRVPNGGPPGTRFVFNQIGRPVALRDPRRAFRARGNTRNLTPHQRVVLSAIPQAQGRVALMLVATRSSRRSRILRNAIKRFRARLRGRPTGRLPVSRGTA
jgi:hypothetical protein